MVARPCRCEYTLGEPRMVRAEQSECTAHAHAFPARLAGLHAGLCGSAASMF